jgi:4-amino-4-deoxy-L-arabinose transferase-like glycosyltransferase
MASIAPENVGLEAGVKPSARRREHAAVSAVIWTRLPVIALLGATAILYLWGLDRSGWANGFYSAAVVAGTKSWKAFFFGSFDAANFITVDKPPAALWVMELSTRVFGINSWSILAPQALEGVAAVGILYAAVRRYFGAVAGLIAGAVFALTPVAVLMFRFNNPDALLVLLLVGSAYATLRAVESGRTRWLLFAAALVGFGFLAKMLQAFLVGPVLAPVFLLAAPGSLRRRIAQLLAAALVMLVSAGWWVAIVALWPAADRPFIGGSQTNSILNLIFGYNGFGRLTGNETGSVGGGAAAAGGTGNWGPTGWTRMFNASYGGQVSWLIPAALVLLVAILWLRRGAPRTDTTRAAALVWGGWLLVTALTFSFAKGIVHPYYTVALAPAIGGLVGMGTVSLWRNRGNMVSRAFLAAAVLAGAGWSYLLLGRSATFLPGLAPLIAGTGILAAIALVVANRMPRRAVSAAAMVALAAAVGGTTAYAFNTASTPHAGAIPSAGPAVAGARNGPGGPGGGVRGPGQRAFGAAGAGAFVPPQGAPGFAVGPPNSPSSAAGGALPAGQPPGAGGAAGGLLSASAPSAAVTTALEANNGSYTWIAATVGANSAAGYQIATGLPVMAIGGFNGTDPWPTLAQFQKLVAQKQVHYFIPGRMGGGPGGGSSGTSSQISGWVQQNFNTVTVGGSTLYDLTSPLTVTTSGG